MRDTAHGPLAPLLPGAAALAIATVYLIALLAVETQSLIIGLLMLAIVTVLGVSRTGLWASVSRSFSEREDALGLLSIVAAFAVWAPQSIDTETCKVVVDPEYGIDEMSIGT